MTFTCPELLGYVYKHQYGAWVGGCPRCGKIWLGMAQSEVVGPVDHHMRTESHIVCTTCRELRSGCGCA